MKKINIAIDGYAACGKSTTAKKVAQELNYLYIDSGAMYRAFTLYLLENNIDYQNQQLLSQIIPHIQISFARNPQTGNYEVTLNDKFVEHQIRSLAVSEKVSKVSTIKEVRAFLVKQQQQLGWQKGVVMDGRDIGTVVFPDAELKVFMDAEFDVRVERRKQELEAQGIYLEKAAIESHLYERDLLDTTRSESPLRKAEDARLLDTTHLAIEEQVQQVLDWAHELIYCLE
ncbi:MAG: (d)CMP kinase [Bacteroidia bacterium]|nr:(d)CMP kinase [Bacteroidia bacterium]MDW8157609.1 (d)CMP kinase [Bacteroidia bacterium]